MLAGMPSLSHEEQQEAVERIHKFMSEGMSSGEAIALVAAEIRERHQNDPQAMAIFEDHDLMNILSLITAGMMNRMRMTLKTRMRANVSGCY